MSPGCLGSEVGGSARTPGPALTPLGRNRVFDELLISLKEGPILLLVAAFLLALLGYALVKRLLKMALFVVVFLAIYLGLLYLMGYELPPSPF